MLPSKPELADHYFNLVDGILLTGGDFDIDPKIYGEKKDKSVVHIDKPRTNFEIKIAKLALKKNKPILGICGGQQLLNVSLNGSLIQHIDKTNIKHEQGQPRNKPSHKVQINLKSKLYKIVKKKEFRVNSAHHQAVNKVGNNLIASGHASDGTIESIEHIKHNWCIGVQWHPEFLITDEDNLLIEDFVKTASNK